MLFWIPIALWEHENERGCSWVKEWSFNHPLLIKAYLPISGLWLSPGISLRRRWYHSSIEESETSPILAKSTGWEQSKSSLPWPTHRSLYCSSLVNPRFSVRLNGFIKLWIPILGNSAPGFAASHFPFSLRRSRPAQWDYNPCGQLPLHSYLMSCLLILSCTSRHASPTHGWSAGASEGCSSGFWIMAVYLLLCLNLGASVKFNRGQYGFFT